MQAHEQVRADARTASRRRLQAASTFAALHCGRPLFKRLMKRPGASAVLVQLEWPGVLRVYDPSTGEILAESEAGQPDLLRGDA